MNIRRSRGQNLEALDPAKMSDVCIHFQTMKHECVCSPQCPFQTKQSERLEHRWNPEMGNTVYAHPTLSRVVSTSRRLCRVLIGTIQRLRVKTAIALSRTSVELYYSRR